MYIGDHTLQPMIAGRLDWKFFIALVGDRTLKSRLDVMGVTES